MLLTLLNYPDLWTQPNEQISVSESLQVVVPFYAISTTQNVSLSESSTPYIPFLAPTITETVTLSESITSNTVIPGIVLSETISVSEFRVALVAYVLSVYSPISVSETLSVHDIFNINSFAEISVAELQAFGNNRSISVSDSVTLLEGVTVLVPVLATSVQDLLSVSESFTAAVPAGNLSVSESISLSEVVFVPIHLYPIIYDAVLLQEGLSVSNGSLGPVQVVETVSVSYLYSVARASQISVIESVSLAESASQFTFHDVSLAESLESTDSLGVPTKASTFRVLIDLVHD